MSTVKELNAASAPIQPEQAIQTTTITPSRGSFTSQIRELWEYRELLYFLVWRDVKVRYKQTLLGATWAVLQPFVTMVVFSIFLGRLARIPSDGLPYPLFLYAGLMPWQFFAQALTQSANSLVGSANLVRKVYFPRIIVPIASASAIMIDFVLAFIVFIGMMIYYQFVPTGAVVMLPLFMLLAIITLFGVGFWLSSLNVQYRDVRHAVPFMVQFWMFATPVIYPSSLLSEPWRTLYGLNPMVGVVEGFRWALLGNNPPGPMILVSALVSIVLFVTGILYFQHVERKFADVI